MTEYNLNSKLDELTELFHARQFSALRAKLLELEPIDIAHFMDSQLDEATQLVFFRLLPKEFASDVFIELDADEQERLIRAFTDKELKEVIDDMYLDDMVDVIDEMPANVVKRILSSAEPAERTLINKLLEYPDDSAGSLMTPEFVSLRELMTVGEAFDLIREQGPNKETIYTCYVTNDRKKLLGVVTVRTLLLADRNAQIKSIMQPNVIKVDTLEDKETVAKVFQKYDFTALPVVDKEGCIVGIVTIDDAVDVIEEEATEDIQKMAAILPSDEPYLKQSVWSIWKSRMPWLLLLMVSATFTGLIINHYEATLNALSPLLFACIPMLMDTGGNAGGQSSVTIIRSLALGDIEFRDIGKILWKELRVAFFLSLLLACVCFAKLQLIDCLIFGYAYTPMMCLAVSLSLFVTIIVAKIVGCILPLLAKKCKLDPAVVASPFVTTIVDAIALMFYCFISIHLLA